MSLDVRQLFAGMYGDVPFSAGLLNKDGVVVAANEAWLEFARVNGTQDSGADVGSKYRPAFDPTDEVSAQKTEDAFRRLLAGEIQDYSFEYAFHFPDQMRWYRLLARPVTVVREKCFLILHLDISSEFIARLGLRKQEAILNLVQDAILQTDLNGVILYANHAASELYGAESAALIGREISEITFAPKNETFIKAREHLLRDGKWAGYVVQKDLKGTKINSSARWNLIADENGEDAILHVYTDLRLAEQLTRTQRMMTVANIAGGIAHDINNILTPIVLLAESIQDDQSSPHSGTAARISGLSDRASALIRQLLGFARGFDGERQLGDVREIVSDVSTIVPLSLPKTIGVHFELGEAGQMILCNRIQVHQVLMNLVINARDAIFGQGTILISMSTEKVESHQAAFVGTARTGSYVCIKVADTGSGMDEKQKEQIFEPFFTTKAIGQGTGLGLSTCLGIVKSHDGFINVDSTPGEGSVFSVYFPLVVTEHAVKAAETPHTEPVADQPILGRILVVDDERSIVDSIQKILQSNGYDVVTAASGEEAIEKVVNSSSSFDLVLTDMNMPGLGGVELIQFLDQFQQEIKVVAMSGASFERSSMREVEKQIVAFLAKPFRSNDVLSVLERALS